VPPASAGPVLRFSPSATDPDRGDVSVILDTTWTPSVGDAADGRIGVRDIAERILAARDISAESTALLDAWARDAGLIELLTIEGTSFWYYVRLRHRMWLDERLIWAGIVRELVTEHAPGTLHVGRGADQALVEVLRLVADRDNLELVVDGDGDEGDAGAGSIEAEPGDRATATATAARGAASPARVGSAPRSPLRRLASRVVRVVRTPPPDPRAERQREIARRLERVASLKATLAAEPHGRLLVVYEHARQRVDTPDGPRSMNPYLDPVVDRLRGTHLEPFAVDIRARVRDDEAWERIGAGDDARVLPWDAVIADAPDDEVLGDGTEIGQRVLEAGRGVPLVAFGIDLAGVTSQEVATTAAEVMPLRARSIARIRRFLEALEPRAILLADEYHRQDWITAARGRGIPVVAVQHGLIHRYHNGYIHTERPPGLQLPDRLYVFGRWERDLLLARSVFREDEVVVGGSPRLDLRTGTTTDPAAVRDQLGIGADTRLVVISGTWGPILRRFHYPIVLARLVDRPLPNVQLVVKLHPGERDEGPYRAVIEGAAAARGFQPPPISTVQWIDLYGLLAAADAHIGIHSTVLTEAVATRTPNLLADVLAEADMLDYVSAGVALPVRDGDDVLRALDTVDRDGLETSARSFSDAHFEPGSASERIATDLLAWLS
jgi:hypothetical protein